MLIWKLRKCFGQRVERWKDPEVGRTSGKQCPLRVTQLLHSGIHSSCSCLLNLPQIKLVAAAGGGAFFDGMASGRISVLQCVGSHYHYAFNRII